jgi:hypothetical protein
VEHGEATVIHQWLRVTVVQITSSVEAAAARFKKVASANFPIFAAQNKFLDNDQQKKYSCESDADALQYRNYGI